MGIIHRDIKSENVLIDIRQNVRIADFGVSYISEQPEPLEPWCNYTSDVKGTIHCMAPEMLRNMEKRGSWKYGKSVDWWAFGCVLYELMSAPDHKELFDSADAVIEYQSWHIKHYGTLLFHPFHQFDPPMADLLKWLLHPKIPLRYGFRQLITHQYFSNEDGTSEFDGACSRALQREKQSQMLPKLRDKKTRPPKIWSALSSGSKHISNVDWMKPRP
ncbi:kinase-like protein [Suillus weaverae]|nr:kinase-like protein [Suillus weaverae]